MGHSGALTQWHRRAARRDEHHAAVRGHMQVDEDAGERQVLVQVLGPRVLAEVGRLGHGPSVLGCVCQIPAVTDR